MMSVRRKSLSVMFWGNANRVPHPRGHTRRVDMVLTMVQTELKVVFHQGSGVFQRNPGRQFVPVPLLHRSDHGEFWATAVIGEGTTTVSVIEYPPQFYAVSGTYTEIGMNSFAHKTIPLHRSTVVEIRAAGRVVQDPKRASGLEQGTVMIKASAATLPLVPFPRRVIIVITPPTASEP